MRRRTPGGGIRELFLEPAFEDPAVETVLLLFGRDLEKGIDPRLQRPLLQEIGAEPVDGADVRLLELLEGALEPLSHLRVAAGSGFGPRLFELASKPELQLARRLLGEGDGDDPRKLAPPARNHREDALHESRGLARACRGLDYERRIEIVLDGVPIGAIFKGGKRGFAHVRLRSQLRGDRRGSFCFLRASICILGPQTAR